MPRAYPLFLCALASWFCAQAMHGVSYQWLLVRWLDLPATQVGVAQTAALLPSLLFLLVGGVAADRSDRRRLLARLHAGQAALFALLALALYAGWLWFEPLLGFALALGTAQAFVMPTRDALVGDVVSGNLSRGIAGMSSTQQAAQVAGAFAAGTLLSAGVELVIALQALIVGLGAVAVWRLPRTPAAVREGPPRPTLVELRAGLVEVLRSPVLGSLFLVFALLGLFFMGTFVVLLPLLVREAYGGSAARLGVINAMVPLGGIVGGLFIVRRGGIGRKGKAFLYGNFGAASCVAALGLRPPFWLAAALTFGWGLGVSWLMTGARTLFQEHASAAHRARVLSVFSLGILGAGPFAALLAGELVRAFGVHVAFLVEGGASLAILSAALVGTRIRTLT